MANRRPCGDLLSDLPVSLIESILVFIPIKDAIRTSILSSKWRFRWTTLPHLVFYRASAGSNALFRTFVTRTLLRHKGPVHKFRLVGTIRSCADTDQWLFFLIRKDIKELILEMSNWFNVPSWLYMFQSLTFLELHKCVFSPPPPNFKGFPLLRSLIIRDLDMPFSTIQSMVEQSPLLESLELTDCLYRDSEMITSALNLKYLKINEWADEHSYLYSFQSLTFLELTDCEFRTPPPSNFKGFPFLRTLIMRELDIPIGTVQSMVEQSPLLESLELDDCLYSDSELIINAPNLKYLNVIFDSYIDKNAFFYAPLLAKLSLSMDSDNCFDDDFYFPKKATYCYYTKVLGGFANLDTLIGVGLFTEYLGLGIEHYQHPLVFHRLKTISLGWLNFDSMDEILVVVRLIVDASATLCDLQLISRGGYELGGSKKTGALWWDSICPQNCTFEKLKFVKVEDFHGGFHETNLIMFLLATSPVLEVLTFKTANMHSKRRVQLSRYPRASSSASILFED